MGMMLAEIAMNDLAVSLLSFGFAMVIASAFFGYPDGD